MKKIISGVLSAVMLTSVLCACNDGGNQSNSSQLGNNADSSQQTVTTDVATTQPATEPNYEDKNYVAPIPPKNQTYKFEEISLEEAATSSGYSATDSKFKIYYAWTEGEYLIVDVTYSDEKAADYCKYDVIYDLDGNMIANISNVSLNEGYDKSVEIKGIYKDYVILSLKNSADSKNKYALYNFKTEKIKYIDSQYDYAYLNRGAITVSKDFKYGALDLNLNEIIPVEYEQLLIASPDRFIALKGNYYGLIDFDNNVVADFKYKQICSFNGLGCDDGSIKQLDFENNINQYTVAIDKNQKSVLIDKNGSIVNDNLETTADKLNYSGRIVAQYGDKTFITYGNSISDTNGNMIIEGVVDDYCCSGYINGYCLTKDKNGNYELVDTKGTVIYQTTHDTEYNTKITPVDQSGLFMVDYYSKDDSNYMRTEILDLAGNIVYTTQEGGFSSMGNGLFSRHDNEPHSLENEGYALYKVAAE